MSKSISDETNTPTKALQDIENILNEFHEDTRVTMCKYLLEICEQTLEAL